MKFLSISDMGDERVDISLKHIVALVTNGSQVTDIVTEGGLTYTTDDTIDHVRARIAALSKHD